MRLAFVVLLCCIAASACSKNGAPAPPVVPPGTSDTINGTERLGWDQRAADPAELSAITYVVYVDGARTPLTDAACATTASASGFACSARLPSLTPGAHALQLASVLNDGGVLESERSATLQVTVRAQAIGQVPDAAAADGVLATTTTSDGLRLRAARVATGLEQPTDLAIAPDGRVFIAERSGRIRIVRDDVLMPEPVLSLAETTGPDTALLAIALDPEFPHTRLVFAIYAGRSRTHELEFTLARFREVSDTLGDRAVLLDRVPAAAAPHASLRFGPDAKLYAAFDDGGEPRRSGDMASLNGKILRLNADGTTPRDQKGSSPVYADRRDSPRGFDWDPQSGLLWAAEEDARGASRLRVAGPAPRDDKAPIAPSGIAFYRGPLFPAFAGRLLIASDTDRQLLLAPSERLLDDRVGSIRAVAIAPDGAIYFATATALGRLVPDGLP